MTEQLNFWSDFLSTSQEFKFNRNGVYLLINDEEMEVYIGESMDILGRIDKHAKSNKEARHKFTRIILKEIPGADKKMRLECEKKVIECVKEFWPKYKILNKRG